MTTNEWTVEDEGGRLVVVCGSYGQAWDTAVAMADATPGVSYVVKCDAMVLASTCTPVDGSVGF